MPTRPIPRTGTWTELSADVSANQGNQRVIAFVPGSDVLLLTANLPPMNRQRMSASLLFALEEQLASDPDSLHFALGRSLSNHPPSGRCGQPQ